MQAGRDQRAGDVVSVAVADRDAMRGCARFLSSTGSLGEGEEVLEVPGPVVGRPGDVELAGLEAAEDDVLAPGPGDADVQSSLAAAFDRGPKFVGILPFACLENAMENMMTSRSSP